MKELDKITEQDFADYVKRVRNDGITNVAPLGFSSDDLIIYETKEKPLRKEFISKEEYEKAQDGTSYKCKGYYDKPVSRSSQLSFRQYSGMLELLITDYEGNFLVHSFIGLEFSDEYIAKKFYELFVDMKPYMNKVIDKIETKIDFKNVKFSEGFKMLHCYTKHKDNLESQV